MGRTKIVKFLLQILIEEIDEIIVNNSNYDNARIKCCESEENFVIV